MEEHLGSYKVGIGVNIVIVRDVRDVMQWEVSSLRTEMSI